MVKEEVVKIIEDETGQEPVLEMPPSLELGDYAWPCFGLPEATSREELVEKLARNELFSDVKLIGGYINFFVHPDELFPRILQNVKQDYGQSQLGKGREVVLEYSGPNTNKPLHIGHLRNNLLGDSVCSILKSQGFKVHKVNIINDRGIHIAKSMLMYQKFGKNQTPKDLDMKPDHFVGHFYQMFKDKYQDEAQELLRKWEGRDQETIKLWKKMNNWAYEGWEKSYKDQGITFDKTYYESDIYKKGKEVVKKGLDQGIFYKSSDGAVEVDFSQKGFDKKVLLRSDGTSLYITQDLYLAELRIKDYPKADKLTYVVGAEQEYYFKVLFEILKLLGFKKDFYHLKYGLVKLHSGKMSSRKGNAVNADDLIDEVMKLSKKPQIALGAVRYYMLHVDPDKDITFDPKTALSFEGNTGPYLMYAYARGKSILKKSQIGQADLSKLGKPLERELALLIEQFPEVTLRAALEYDPSLVTNYLYKLAQAFSSFYHQHPVKNNPARQELVKAVCQVLKNGCSMLGIEVLEQM